MGSLLEPVQSMNQKIRPWLGSQDHIESLPRDIESEMGKVTVPLSAVRAGN